MGFSLNHAWLSKEFSGSFCIITGIRQNILIGSHLGASFPIYPLAEEPLQTLDGVLATGTRP